MPKVIVAGAAGRMGQRIIYHVNLDSDLTLVGALEKSDHPAVGKDAGEIANVDRLGVPIAGLGEGPLPAGDVIIDFSAPEATLALLEKAAGQGIASVIATTGFSPEQAGRLKDLAVQTRCVQAPNMSMGINVMFKIIDEMARTLGDEYDMEVVETHHRFKKDAPSGTALRMGDILARALDRDLSKVGVYGRKGVVGERTLQEVGIHAVRAGDVIGDHTVLFAGHGERLELTHRTHSRDNFARGAVRAAKWVVNQPQGVYDMLDVLGLK